MIQMLFDKAVSTQRLGDIEETDTETFSENLTSVECNIQPLEDSLSEDIEGNYGQDFLMFCGDEDIEIGDKIIDGSDIYLVKGLEKYTLMGQTHMELTIRKQ